MNADERVETYDFGLNQAKHGLVLAKGERIIDCFDYDTYRVRDKVNSCVTVENSVLLTNKRLVQMRFSDSKRRTEKRNTEIPVDRIECVNSYYKHARYLNPWLVAIFGILALAFLVFGILTAAIPSFPKVLPDSLDMIIAFSVGGIFAITTILLIVLPKRYIAFGITVYTKDNPETPFRIFNLSTSVGHITQITNKNEDCFTADITEAKRMAFDLANEVTQAKIENEMEDEKNGSELG